MSQSPDTAPTVVGVPASSPEGPALPQYPTISFRLDRHAYQALGILAGQRGSSPSLFAKGATCLALARALREFAAQTESEASERGFATDDAGSLHKDAA